MKRALPGLIALLSVTTLLLSVTADADPRDIAGPPEPATPEMIEARRLQQAADIATLLPRLVGKFDVEGVFGPESPRPMTATGKADCVAIGAGPGVQCVFHVVWGMELQGQGVNVRMGSSFLAPAAYLFGFDPNEVVVRTMQLDTSGVAEDMPTTINGDTLSWCKGDMGDFCYKAYAPPEADSIQVTLYVGVSKVQMLNLRMQRPTKSAPPPPRTSAD